MIQNSQSLVEIKFELNYNIKYALKFLYFVRIT